MAFHAELEYMTTEEVAHLLRLDGHKQPRRAVQRLIREEGLPAYRVGRRYLVRRDELAEFLGKKKNSCPFAGFEGTADR